MKKTLVALAALSAIAGAAQAQSSVTMYGLIDQFYTGQTQNAIASNIAGTPTDAQKSGHMISFNKSGLVDGSFNGSRLGFKGSEDLGSGLAVIFNLEAGINSQNGSSTQGSTLFGRRSIVGLSSTSWGTVGFGRNSSPFDDVAANGEMMQTSASDPSITNNAPQALITKSNSIAVVANTLLTRGFAGNGNTTWIGYSTRFNNSIRWTSPNWSGFATSFMYGQGEDNIVNADGSIQNASQMLGLNATYTAGPLLLTLGYQSEAQGGTQATTAAGLAGATTTVGKNQNSFSTATTTQNPALNNTLVSVAYDMGVARFGLAYNQAQFQDVNFVNAAGVTGAMAANNEYSLSVAVPFGATTLSAAYAQSSGDSTGKASGYGLQAKYQMSPRTFVYAGYTQQTPFDTLTQYVQAQGGTVSNVSSYAVGIQHRF